MQQAKQNAMSDSIREYLQSKHYAKHVINGGLEALLSRWEWLVNSVAHGHEWGYEEWVNEMSGRRILEEVLALLPLEEQVSTRAHVTELDERLKSYLIPVSDGIIDSKAIRRHGYTPERDWWYFHFPPNKEK